LQNSNDMDAAALLSYYRSKVGGIEEEREDMVHRMSLTEVSHAELHRAKWELRVREEEIRELQKALSDSNVHMFKERGESLKLLAENDELKIHEVENRRRIQHLLALTNPVAQEVTFFKDCRPMLMSRKLGKSKKTNEVQIVKNEKLMVDENNNGTASKTKHGAIMRTIYLPNEQTDSLSTRVKSLEHLLEEHQKNSSSRIESLETDKKEREDAHKRALNMLTKQVEALEMKLDSTEKSARVTTKDFLQLKHTTQLEERKLMEQLAKLGSENEDLKTQIRSVNESLVKETNAIRASVLEDNNRQLKEFRYHAVNKKGRLNSLQEEHAKLKHNSAEEIRKLKKSNQDLRKKLANLEKRRQFDFEGFQNDITDMRKLIRALELLAYGSVLSEQNNNSNHVESSQIYSSRASVLRNELDYLREKISKLEAHQDVEK